MGSKEGYDLLELHDPEPWPRPLEKEMKYLLYTLSTSRCGISLIYIYVDNYVVSSSSNEKEMEKVPAKVEERKNGGIVKKKFMKLKCEYNQYMISKHSDFVGLSFSIWVIKNEVE